MKEALHLIGDGKPSLLSDEEMLGIFAEEAARRGCAGVMLRTTQADVDRLMVLCAELFNVASDMEKKALWSGTEECPVDGPELRNGGPVFLATMLAPIALGIHCLRAGGLEDGDHRMFDQLSAALDISIATWGPLLSQCAGPAAMKGWEQKKGT